MENNSFEIISPQAEETQDQETQPPLILKPKNPRKLKTPTQADDSPKESGKVDHENDLMIKKEENLEVLEINFSETKKIGRMPKLTGKPAPKKPLQVESQFVEEGNSEIREMVAEVKEIPKANPKIEKKEEIKEHTAPAEQDKANEESEPPVVPFIDPTDRPLGSKPNLGGYNLDNLEELEKQYKPSNKAKGRTVAKPPAEQPPENPAETDALETPKAPAKPKPKLSSMQKKEPVQQKDEEITEVKVNNFVADPSEDRPLKSKAEGYNLDELDKVQDNYVPSGKGFKKKPEQPPAPVNVEEDERPVGGIKSNTGGYNLDNLEEMEKMYKPSNKAKANVKPALAKSPTLKKEEEPKPEEPAENPKAKPKPPVKPKPDQVAPEPVENTAGVIDEMPIGMKSKTNQFAEEFPPGQGEGGDAGEEDVENTLAGKMTSSKFQVRILAFEEVCKWSDPEMTPEIFAKGLHLTIKEKHPQVIDKLLSAIESLIETKKAAWTAVDFKKFMLNFSEHLLNNVKGASKDHSTAFILKLYEVSNKEEFLEQIKGLMATIKVKCQEKALFILLELVKAGKIEEMKFLKALWPDLEKQITSRTVTVKNIVMDIYKEAFLWMGEGLRVFLTGLKKPQMDELDAYFKTIDASKMKTLKKGEGGGKAKAFDAYDIVAEFELPKKFNEDSWVDEVLELKKWSEKKEKLDELNELLIKNPKLSPKTNSVNFLTLARRIFMDPNVVVQTTMIKSLGLLAAGLRKHFGSVAKTLFPVLLGKLKEKKAVTEEILITLEKFYMTLTFDETHDDIKEHLNDKNTDKKMNMLKLLILMAEKLDRIKTEANAVKTVKLVIKLIDENDAGVRDMASQLIARLKDNFNDKVTPLLSDLNSQKMSKIQKFCQNSSTLITSSDPKDKTNTTTAKEDKVEADNNKDRGSTRKVPGSMTKDKSQMIADMRENLFSNKTVKLSDTKNFSNFLYTNLKNLVELTKEFKEVSTSQSKEILLLIQEIAAKVDKAAFHEDSRKIIAQFYMEQLLSKNSDEINESIDQYVYNTTKITSPKIFLSDLIDVIGRKSIKVSRELLVAILKIIDKETSANSQLALMPHKAFAEFLKTNFSGQSIHASYKTPLLNTLRNYSKKFGEKSMNDFPTSLLKEMETQNNEAQRAFAKTLEKLNDKNPDKKKAALTELSSYEESSKILLFWNNNEFVTFLKRMLIMETKGQNYSSLLAILTKYLNIFTESPSEFSMKTFLFVFHAVLTHYYDRRDIDSGNPEIETLIRTAVSTLNATTILNEFISDSNSSAWKEQILNFFFQYSNEIEPSIKFINYIVALIGLKGPSNEFRPLIESVLLLLKNTNNDEIILKGNENKYIREIWQKNEEDLLINENFVKGYKVFEDAGSFQIIKNFISESLKLEENGFYTRNLESYALVESDSSPKIKLAYYYMRSVENLSRVSEFILRQLFNLELSCLDSVSVLIALKITFQLLKNLFYMQGDSFFSECRELFVRILHRIPYTFEEFFKVADFNGHEVAFFKILVDNEEFSLPEVNQGQLSTKNAQWGMPVTTINDLPPNQTPIPIKDNSRNISQNANQDKRRPSHVGGFAFDEESVQMVKNQRDNLSNLSPRSHISSSKKGPVPTAQKNNKQKPQMPNESMNNGNFNNPPENMNAYMSGNRNSTEGLENPMLLQEKFEKMLTFDLVEFEDASEYFKALCRSPHPSSLNFLKTHSNDIIKVFVDVCTTVFNEGINYELERTSYELIFMPFQQICAIEGLIESLQQPIVNLLVDHVLLRLVLSNDEKTILEQNNEDQGKQDLAGFMVKFWNSIMLRIIEHSETNALLTALFILIINSKNFEVDKLQQAMYNLAFKCIIRITRNLKNIITKINPRVVLNLIYSYIQTFGVRNSESLGSKSIKTLLHELVNRSDPEFIWNCYFDLFGEQGEPHISKWIKIIQSKNGGDMSRSNNLPNYEQELYDIIQEINKQTRISQIGMFINDIRRILEEVPNLDIRNFMEVFANKTHFEYVIKELRANKSPSNGFNNTGANPGVQHYSGQGMGGYNSTNASSNQKGLNNTAAKGNIPSTKKTPVSVKRAKNIDDVLNKSDLDTSEMYRRMDDRSRYNFN